MQTGGAQARQAGVAGSPRLHRWVEHALVPRPAQAGLPHSRPGRAHARGRGRALRHQERAGALHRQGQV
ncbi:hypothetical protein G6F32_016790 [Rhizopus arrhizus]|nr:hypothetical protein G6F32_016790 [Rhizopus arrhizus]